ncbi:3-hydroxybutyryl-CoA dehydrogenase [Knoellia locipacati]|uniref:3-hydroxybutyryl-CoA dehydrogenase n=1 Tax=Knoellia locipacati TaxID=882824 RepID=A0A512SXV4_9MICO|nr:3-hydroxyacyl-CoA dehydrogenase NAD-binding domain-containing protein [Knoellia locipacati]GEQ12755.1 3-hydroxybutyryl-CoA dehydrogenase [Knoellia locipacati]
MSHRQDATNTCSTERVAVVGAGIMGRGIAQLFATAGARVSLVDSTPEAASAGRDRIAADLRRAAERRASRSDASSADDEVESAELVLGRIRVAELDEAVADATAVIEAVPEILDLKRDLLADVARTAPAEALLTTNTSALPITSIAAGLPQPERLVGLHFFNPVHRMRLVEVIAGLASAEDSVLRARDLCERAGKTTVRVVDRPGFVASRVNVLIGNEAFRMLTEGVATADEIDIALTHGLNHPMGPFELIDLVGLDTRLSVLRSLHASLGDRFRPDPTHVSLVEAGRLGRKTGRGVYTYDDTGRRVAP